MTDQEFILKWLEWLEHSHGRSPRTINQYLDYLQRLVVSLKEKEIKLREATLEHLESFTGIEAHQAGMRPRSRLPLVAAVRGFYKWAHKSGWVGENPAMNLVYPRIARTQLRGMTLSNAEKLLMNPDLDTFLGVRDAAILSVFIGCGLRVSGVCRLNQRDLIFAEDPKTGHERLVLRVREKGDNERLVPAPHETRLLIRAYLGHEDLDQVDRRLPDGDQVLFISTNCRTIPPHEYYGEARRISSRSIADMMERHGKQAMLPRNECHPHAIRHLYGTELAEEDIQMLKIQALMGHKDPKSTNEYVQIAVRSLAKAVDKGNPLSKMRTPVTELARALSASK